MLSPALLLRRGSSRALSVLALASSRTGAVSPALMIYASPPSSLIAETKRLAAPSSLIRRPSFAAAAAAARSSSSSSTSSSSSSSSTTRYTPVKVEEETKLYWQHLLSDLRRPSAARLARSLDLDFVLGLSGNSSFSAPPLARFFAAVKERHPTKIALVRVGEFYETIGADAVLLVEHAALNPMGSGPNAMPRAGFPASNLRRTLDDLVRGAALSVVVCEEAPEAYSYGARARKKERYVAGVVTPAQPHYLVNSLDKFGGGGGGGGGARRGGGGGGALASGSSVEGDGSDAAIDDTTSDDDDTIDATPPILGVSAVASSAGFTVVEVDAEMRRFAVSRGLTEDAVSARLFSGGLSPPLYLHSPDDAADARRFADASAEQEWSKRVATLFRREVGVVKRYGFGGGGGVAGGSFPSGEVVSSSSSSSNSSHSSSSPSLEPAVAHLLAAVRRDLGLPPNEPFAEVKKGMGAGASGGAAARSTAATTGNSGGGRGPQIYLCTASQLGIHRQRGVPSLLDALLPSAGHQSSSSSVPLASRRWLERLLLMPPAPAVALDIRRALEALASPYLGSVPRWVALPAPHVVLKLRSGEASAGFFRDLVAMLDAVAGVTKTTVRGEEPKEQLRALAQALLSPTAEETGTRLSLQELSEACERAIRLVEATVADVRGAGSGSGSAAADELDDSLVSSELEAAVPSRALRSSLLDLFDANEGPYRGQVHASLLAEELAAVEAARDRVARAAAELVSAVSSEKRGANAAAAAPAAKRKSAKSGSSSRAAASPKKPEVVFDAVNNAVWVRMPRGGNGKANASASVGASAAAAADDGSASSSSASSSLLKVIHPLDRYGRRVSDRWSSAELEEALDAYRRRCVAARSAVRGALRALARELADGGGGDGSGSGSEASDQTQTSSSSVSTMVGLVSAATFSTIGCALDAHAREAAARGWGLPRLVGVGEEGASGGDVDDADPAANGTRKNPAHPTSSSSSSSSIAIKDFWPYWKERRDSEANSIDLRSMALLTGPNMAGKSTVLRSVAACSLLASCGLRAPAATAEVPVLDAIVLRAFAADAPSSGRSSFAVEMDETRHVLAAAAAAASSAGSSAKSLILVDELGKGTEPAAGAAVAGAVLESLAEKGCLGLFATHLHELLELPLEGYGKGGGERQQQRFCMATKRDPVSAAKVPAWRLAEGDSTESLAIEVAAEARVDPRVVSRAAELYAALCAKRSEEEEEEATTASALLSRTSDAAAAAVGGGTSAIDASIAPRAEEGVSLSSPALSVSNPPLFSLEDAAAVLSSAAAAVLRQQHQHQTSTFSPSLQTTFQAPPPAASLVRAGWAPPPAVVGRSCVYVVRRADGYFYCGESDDLVARLAAHRGGSSTRASSSSSSSSSSPVGGGNSLEAAFVVVEGSRGGKSAARAIEAATIRSMVRAGLPLLSEADGVHRSGLVIAAVEGEASSAAA